MNYKNNSRYLIIIAVLSICIILCMNKSTDFKGWEAVNKYIQPNVTIFIGDSITKGADFKEAFNEQIVLNKGISGNTTIDVLNRLDKDIYQFNPYKVFLLIGINDIGKNFDNKDTIKNIKLIVNNIKRNCPHVKIYLQSIYPVNNTNDKKIQKRYFKYRNNKDVIEINKELKIFANSNNITYIDIYSHLLDEKNNLKLSYTKEGLHLNKDGYETVLKVLNSYVYK